MHSIYILPNDPQALRERLAELAHAATGIPPAQLQYGKTPLGKPLFFNAPGFHFSISHSRDMALLAVSDKPVGADIEHPRPYKEAFGRRFFTPNECAYIASAPLGMARDERFVEIWTRKEAYLKREGLGLRVALRSFDVLAAPPGCFSASRHGEAIATVCLTI